MIRLLCLSVIFSLTFAGCSAPEGSRTFYVDPATGNDKNNGLSPEKAWASLAKVNTLTLAEGDQLLLRAGAVFIGQLELKGSGSKETPVRVGSYGGEQRPIIHGKGEKKYTLLIRNMQFVEVNDLEITNTGATREARRTGVLIEGVDSGDLHHIHLNNLFVHDVNGSLVKEEGGGSAIFWSNRGDSIPTRFVGLTIENCLLQDCGRNGITSSGYAGRDKWYPSLGVIIRGNVLEGIPGDGIVPIGCDSVLIEYNVMRNSPDILSHQEAAAGIWPWSCDNTVIQYNEVSGHQAKWDGQGFDSDYNCTGTIIRYNYSHDNNGGFLLLCNDGGSLGKNWNHGTKNSVIEFNLSVNDGLRPYPTERAGWFSPVVHITGPVENSVLSHNILIVPPKERKEIPYELFRIENWGNAWPVNTIIAQNLFVVDCPCPFRPEQSEATRYEANQIVDYTDREPQTILALINQLTEKGDVDAKAGYRELRNFVGQRLK